MAKTRDQSNLAPWVRRFLMDYLIGERNLSANTRQSYRDSLRLLLPFVARRVGRRVDDLRVVDVSAETVRAFLKDLEEVRGCRPATRNQRLAAVRSLARFIGDSCPEQLQWVGEIQRIPCKKTRPRPVAYLEQGEMDALLAAPNRRTPLGRRDHCILLFLLNTGARADEVARTRVCDLELDESTPANRSWILLHGKGAKQRHCPLWRRTVKELRPLIVGRSQDQPLFNNREGDPLTRFGIRGVVKRNARIAAKGTPSLAKKRVTTHTIRHTAAMHLLRAGVDINTIRAWLGHESLSTTNIYAEADLEMKAKALAQCEQRGAGSANSRSWREDRDLMAFLRDL